VLAFSFAISFGVGILFGLLPAWRIAAQPPQTTLREGGRTVHGSRHRTQDWLVIFEMAAAVVLLAGAGLTLRSLFALSHTDPGFDPNGVLRFSVAATHSPALDSPAGARSYLRQLDQQIRAVPGISAVSLTNGGLPMTGDDDEELFWFQNEPKPANANDMHWSLLYIVEPEYLDIMRIHLLRGRWFTDADRENTPRVVVIDQDLAHKYFGDADPIGKVMNLTNPDDSQATVIGVVGHVLQWGLDNDAGFSLHSEVYLPLGQLNGAELVSTTGFFYDVLVRAPHPDAVFADIRSATHRMNSAQVVWRPLTMNQIIDQTLAARRFSMILLGAFAALALLLASVGLYGVISYLVGQRTQEMAIRMALGADRSDVLRWVLRRGAALAAIGVATGTLAALLVTRIIAGISIAKSSIIYGVHPWDPITLVGVVALLMFVALLASYIPARRAASVDPMQALRSE
jgi:predicted permease